MNIPALQGPGQLNQRATLVFRSGVTVLYPGRHQGFGGRYLILSPQRGGLEVAILVVAQAPGMTAEEDAALVEALGLEGSPPAGGRIRLAGPTVDGWRIVSLWDNDTDYESFRDERLVPALSGLGRVLSTIEMWPIQTVSMLRMT